MPSQPVRSAALVLPWLVWGALRVCPAPEGLAVSAWHYFAVFAAAITALVVTGLPGGAIGLMALSFLTATGAVHDDPAESIAWALAGFSDPTVWLTFGAFLFAIGYRRSGLGRRIALMLVRRLGRRTLGLGYAIALADLALAPGTPSNTARSGGTIYPIVSQIPPLYGSTPGAGEGRIGSYVMWTAFASTAVTSSMFITALVPNAAAVAMAHKATGVSVGWLQFALGFAPAGILLLLLVPALSYALLRPKVGDSSATVEWAHGELEAMGPVTRAEWTMAALVLLAIWLWVTGSQPYLGLPWPGAGSLHPVTVVLVAASAMLLLGVITWDDLTGDREAWGVFLYFATVLTLADGLSRTGFIGWFAQRASAPLHELDPRLTLVAMLALFFWSHYLFASVTSHALAVLPVVLALAQGVPGLDAPMLAMLCVHALGLMGVISPYATGCAPIYAASGYLGRSMFWALGAGFGMLYFAALLGVVWPWLTWGPVWR